MMMNPIKSKADLAGKVVGVQQASTGESALQNDPSGKFKRNQILC